MNGFFQKFSMWLYTLRAYSLPISVMSWSIPFLFAFLDGGSFIYGIIALLGIVVLHLATNIFDDIVDYIREKNLINKGLKKTFNFQKNKCSNLLNGNLSFKQYLSVAFILFVFALFVAVFFLFKCGFSLLYILIPTTILCLLYPILGCLGLGEIIVAIVFSPLLYSGVYFVMTGTYNFEILLISFSTGLLSVAVLHNHMLLDFRFDEDNRKTTLCRLCKTEKNALILLFVIIFFAFFNIFISVIWGLLSPLFMITFFSLPIAFTLYKVMKIHITNPKQDITPNIFMGNVSEIYRVPVEERNFLIKFIIVRNLLSFFTSLIFIAILLTRFL